MKTKYRQILKNALLILTFSILIFSCATAPYPFRTNYNSANKLIHSEANTQNKLFLKAHLKDGGVIILRDNWNIDTLQNELTGIGSKYDYKRRITYEGVIAFPIDSIVIFETNKKLKYDEGTRVTGLAILATLDAIMGVICLTVPKACFGSCPTFYIDPTNNFHYADAEGFSHAFLPSREYGDVDALPSAGREEKDFIITMKNEALETHCINDVRLFAYPIKEGEAVCQTRDNEFFLCDKIYPLTQSTGIEGDNTNLLRNNDHIERFSLADEKNLKCSEEIMLTFDSLTNNVNRGLIISFRQTLMTTYFIYSSMGYMGKYLGDFYADMETGKMVKKNGRRFYEETGEIDVYAWDDTKKDWMFQGGWYETGPIAMNKQILPLKTKNNNNSLKIKLVLNKGLWRIDYLALTDLKEKIQPREIEATEIIKNGNRDEIALTKIKDSTDYIYSMPGDEFSFRFELPEKKTYEKFLYSKGYYLEWMRNDWLKDQDLMKIRLMSKKPDKFFRKQAAEYKEHETLMEQLFWDSKIDTKTFSYHEN